MGKPLKHFVILGGGTSGWMAAAGLARLWRQAPTGEISIDLIESEEISTVGVGEATIPPILDFLKFLNVSEADFIQKTQATYKLAIQFKNWKNLGHDYWHPFGTLGPNVDSRPLYQHWLRQKQEHGSELGVMDLSIAAQMAKRDRFSKPSQDPRSSLSGLGYALHFDAGLVAQYLRGYAEHHGVVRTEGRVSDVVKSKSGEISHLVLSNGQIIKGDFFIDCSGFRGLLISEALGTPYEDWSSWLPCDRAVAAPCAHEGALHPYTVAEAQTAGWTWQIPLQSRVGNGYVYSSRFCTDEQATQTLKDKLGDRILAEPRYLKFTPGRRKETWVKNCLALGLASGFLEPLESTSIHLVFANLFRFFDHFPSQGDNEALRQSFNQKAVAEIEEIRDFLILHYCTSQRRDSGFWAYVTSMALPDSLRAKMDLFKHQGRILTDFYDLFKPLSWISVYDGMGVEPMAFDPLINAFPQALSDRLLKEFSAQVHREAEACPLHQTALGQI